MHSKQHIGLSKQHIVSVLYYIYILEALGSRQVERNLCFLLPEAASAKMVARGQKKIQFRRWIVYFARDSKLSRCKRTLKQVVVARKTNVTFWDAGPSRVELYWRDPVKYDNARRLLRLAWEMDTEFTFLGDIQGIEDDVAPTPQATKRRRLWTKTAAASANEGDHWKHGPETAASAAYAAAASAAASLFPSRLLPLKLEQHFASINSGIEGPAVSFEVCWDEFLGEGAYGAVYAGKRLADPNQKLAIKLLRGDDASAEVKRYASLPKHANIVELEDVGVFPRTHRDGVCIRQRRVGLAFPRFEMDLRHFLQKLPLRPAGMRHVLGSVCRGLAHIHGHGLVHTDLKPDNVLLRGGVGFRQGWFARLLAAKDDVTFTEHLCEWKHHLPAALEVLHLASHLPRLLRRLLNYDC